MAKRAGRASVRWVIPAPLTPRARGVLAAVLDCRFTDEDRPRTVTQVAPDVQLVVAPGPDSCVVVAHFVDAPDVPATQEEWLSDWIARAAQMAKLPAPGPAEDVRTGLY